MSKAFEKILERLILESSSCKVYKLINPNKEDIAEFNAYKKCIEIVKEVAEEYNGGWIPCSERLPEEYGEYLVWWTDITRGQYYEIVEYESDNGWIGEIPQAFEGKYSVIAWQPLPEPFKECD